MSDGTVEVESDVSSSMASSRLNCVLSTLMYLQVFFAGTFAVNLSDRDRCLSGVEIILGCHSK